MRGPNTSAIQQASYCAYMAIELQKRIEKREGKRSSLGTVPGYGYGIGQLETRENIDRTITQLRAELLELRKIIEKGEL